MPPSDPPDVFAYLDYRAFLRDAYDYGKAHAHGYSYRALARRAGFESPSYIRFVMHNKRNLSEDASPHVGRAFGLERAALRYFQCLVSFDRAKTPQAKNELLDHLSMLRRTQHTRLIDAEMFEYLSHWYYPAIREMVSQSEFKEDAKWIGQRLCPNVNTSDVKRALHLLLDLELIVRDDEGRLRRGEPTISTGPEIGALAVGNYHRQMMTLAMESIQRVPNTQRDISALTVCVPETMFEEIKQRIQAFRAQLLAVCDEASSCERVYQINIQLFPLTHPKEQP